MRVVFRVDASRRIGTGHVMRCVALAEDLRKKGASVEFISRPLLGHLIDLVRERGFEVRPLPAASGWHKGSLTHSHWLEEAWETDARQTSSILENAGGADWLIVDHYALDASWERLTRAHAGRLLIIDDLADRAHECNVLLNQNLGVRDVHYSGLVPRTCKLLLGPRFALLHPEFRKVRMETAVRQPGGERRLLVFLGGSDPSDGTSTVLDALSLLPNLGCRADIVVGAANANAERLRKRCSSMSGVKYHHAVNNMHELMAQATLGVFSAGTSTWERCAIGLPAIVIAIAENQRHIAEQTEAAGASWYLGEAGEVSARVLADVIDGLLNSSERLESMGRSARHLVDGFGVPRVAAAVIGGPLKLSVVSDRDSWINEHLHRLVEEWAAEGHSVRWVYEVGLLEEGDCAFFLGCSQLAGPQSLARNAHNLVVHESALPQGKGWAPLTWQVLEGKKHIPVVLIEAVDKVDSGEIYLNEVITLQGHELCRDLRAAQAQMSIALCRRFVREYPWIVMQGRPQEGQVSFYRRRGPQDSRLDPDASLGAQFNLLRTVDNERYPAFFDLNGHRYIVRIDRAPADPQRESGAGS